MFASLQLDDDESAATGTAFLGCRVAGGTTASATEGAIPAIATEISSASATTTKARCRSAVVDVPSRARALNRARTCAAEGLAGRDECTIQTIRIAGRCAVLSRIGVARERRGQRISNATTTTATGVTANASAAAL